MVDLFGLDVDVDSRLFLCLQELGDGDGVVLVGGGGGA